MCDEWTEGDLDRVGLAVSRRAFAGLAVGGALVAAPALAKGPKLKRQDVAFATPDGRADAYFVAPARGRHAAVLIWPDIRGLRPAFRQMADRLAGDGFAVLAINPFYRDAPAPVVTPTDDFADPVVRDRLMGYAKKLNFISVAQDSGAVAEFLLKQKSVDPRRKFGVAGYCMGGPLTIATAAALPDHVGACASFHGSRLTSDAPDSPHLAIARTRAQYLFAIAENDDVRNPAEKDLLRAALAGRSGMNEVEVYAGAMHGWCPPDGRAYNAAAAEKAWGRMLALFRSSL